MSDEKTIKKFVTFLKSKKYDGNADKDGKIFNTVSNDFGLDSSFIMDRWDDIEKEMKTQGVSVIKENIMEKEAETKEPYSNWLRKNTTRLREEYREYVVDMDAIEEEPMSFEEWSKETYENTDVMNEDKTDELVAIINILGSKAELEKIVNYKNENDLEGLFKNAKKLIKYYKTEMPEVTRKGTGLDNPEIWIFHRIKSVLEGFKNEESVKENSTSTEIADKIEDMSPEDKKVYDTLKPEQKKIFDSLLDAIRYQVKENTVAKKLEEKYNGVKVIEEARSLLKDAPDVQDKPKDVDDVEAKTVAPKSDSSAPSEKLSKDEPAKDVETKEEPTDDAETKDVETKEEPTKEEPEEKINETAFTKQHYIAIAGLLSKSETKDEIVKGLSEIFKKDNPKFDEAKFIDYVGSSK